MSAFQSFRSWAAASTVAHVAFAFALMGGWAVFANRYHPLPDALQAGAVQGTVSSILTLGLKKFLEWISCVMERRRPRRHGASADDKQQRLSDHAHAGEDAGGPYYAALIVPPIVTAAAILAILVAAHTLAGTPEIAATIAFPFTVSTTYAIVYNLRLWRAAHGR